MRCKGKRIVTATSAAELSIYSTENMMNTDQTYWGWHLPALDLPLYNGFIYYFWLQFRTQAISVYAAQYWAYAQHPGWYLPILANTANCGEPLSTTLPESWW